MLRTGLTPRVGTGDGSPINARDLTSAPRAGKVASAFSRADLIFSLRARYKSG
jgi:hypothetical protein